MSNHEARLLDHLPEGHTDDALAILFHAFQNKFRHGFRREQDFVRLFCRGVRRRHCNTAFADGRLAGIVTYSTGGAQPREFYHVSGWRLFTTFSPLTTLRVLFNLMLLQETAPAGEFRVESIAVHADARGLGIGAQLMDAAEARARAEGYALSTLDVLSINAGAIRLYERLGYTITGTQRGFWVWLATTSDAVHRMEKPLR